MEDAVEVKQYVPEAPLPMPASPTRRFLGFIVVAVIVLALVVMSAFFCVIITPAGMPCAQRPPVWNSETGEVVAQACDNGKTTVYRCEPLWPRLKRHFQK